MRLCKNVNCASVCRGVVRLARWRMEAGGWHRYGSPGVNRVLVVVTAAGLTTVSVTQHQRPQQPLFAPPCRLERQNCRWSSTGTDTDADADTKTRTSLIRTHSIFFGIRSQYSICDWVQVGGITLL